MASPRDYGLPHDEWYPNQESSVSWLAERKKTAIIEAPTGSGKTGILAAQAANERVLALVRTKFLQQENYENSYGFDVLYGKSNYQCIHREADPGTTVADCKYGDSPHRCMVFEKCPYYHARNIAKASGKASTNYSYWLNVYRDWELNGLLGCDEGHQLSEITLDWSGIRIDEDTQKEYQLPLFPMIKVSSDRSVLSSGLSPVERIIKYLDECLRLMESRVASEKNKSDAGFGGKGAVRRAELLRDKISATISAMNSSQEGWFIRSGIISNGNFGKDQWGLIARPLTARYHFPAYFASGDWRLAIMSATIGNNEVFADELGISEYDFLSVPSSWAPSTRPVYALDVPRLGQKAPMSAYEKQADEITKAILSVDRSWSGIVHSTSIAESQNIARRLHRRGLQDRVFVPDRAPTNVMIDRWQKRLRQRPNSIMVCWAMWEGYDGTQEKINIVAKTPYPYLGDPYEVERRNFNGKFYIQRAAWQMEQGLGRTRRGKESDYDVNGETNGLVAIADNGWRYIKKYLSKSLLESIQTGG